MFMDFLPGNWVREIDVRDFIQRNYTPYEGDESFLKPPARSTEKLWAEVRQLLKQEVEQGGVIDIDTKTVSTITSHKPGFINKDLEKIVGLQTDAPLKRAIMPFGGIRLVKTASEAYGYEIDPEMETIFTQYRKTHNQGVFDTYTD